MAQKAILACLAVVAVFSIAGLHAAPQFGGGFGYPGQDRPGFGGPGFGDRYRRYEDRRDHRHGWEDHRHEDHRRFGDRGFGSRRFGELGNNRGPVSISISKSVSINGQPINGLGGGVSQAQSSANAGGFRGGSSAQSAASAAGK